MRIGLCFALLFAASPLLAEDKAVEIFDGKSLKNWDGNPKFWKVEDGAITGQTTKDNPTRGNTFLIWRGGKLGDFELTLEYRIQGGNSGIQYRSFETKQKWVVGGYQADIDSGTRYSGIVYGEKFRGILCDRGLKTTLTRPGNKLVKKGERFGDSKKINEQISKGKWRTYRILAKGYHFTQWINGVKTAELIDNDEKQRRADGILALQLHAGPPMKIQFRKIKLTQFASKAGASIENKDKTQPVALKDAKKRYRVAFVAGRRSHGFGSHEHKAGCMLLAKAIKENMSNFDTKVFTGGWPKDENALDGFDCIVMYSDGGGGHPVNRHLERVDKYAKRGTGIVCIHYAVEVPKGKSGERFLDWIGGYFETHWSVNPHWTAKFKAFPKHPIASGVKPFEINDEWYYHMRFQAKLKGVTPILSDLPPPSSLRRRDGAHSGNPHVRKAVLDRKEKQHVAWAYERGEGRGRGFGFTGGHVHWNWGNNQFRKLVLNAIVWTAGAAVPDGGVKSKPLSVDDLLENQDFKPRRGWKKEGVEKMLKAWNG